MVMCWFILNGGVMTIIRFILILIFGLIILPILFAILSWLSDKIFGNGGTPGNGGVGIGMF